MARFIDQPNERTLVNKHVDSYMNGVNQYAKYIDSTPSFVTYYSRDLDHSMENPGLGTVKEVVGYESPNRYNKVLNFPLYAVEELNPSITDDGISGLSTDVESTAVILPDTLVPKPDDLFVFTYMETEEDYFRVYRITNVDINALDSNSYYQISYVSTSYDYKILNSRQIVDDYTFIYSNIGTKQESVVLKSTYLELGNLEKIYDSIATYYVTNFYNSDMNSFIYQENGLNLYAPDIQDFIADFSLFVKSRTFLTNIKPTNLTTYDYKTDQNNLYRKFYLLVTNLKGKLLTTTPEEFAKTLSTASLDTLGGLATTYVYEPLDPHKNPLLLNYPIRFVRPVYVDTTSKDVVKQTTITASWKPSLLQHLHKNLQSKEFQGLDPYTLFTTGSTAGTTFTRSITETKRSEVIDEWNKVLKEIYEKNKLGVIDRNDADVLYDKFLALTVGAGSSLEVLLETIDETSVKLKDVAAVSLHDLITIYTYYANGSLKFGATNTFPIEVLETLTGNLQHGAWFANPDSKLEFYLLLPLVLYLIQDLMTDKLNRQYGLGSTPKSQS